MARTGQPSRERVASAGRSLAILDVLATGGALGTNEIARRAGTTASTVSRQLGTLVEPRLDEREPELNAIAAPVRSSDGELAGIVALQGPIPRFGRGPARRALPFLLEQAEKISAELGGRTK